MEAVIHQSLLERGDQAVDRLATFLAQGEGHFDSARNTAMAMAQMIHALRSFRSPWNIT